MTERWQKQLKKLGSIEAPEELRARVDHGPSGDDLPPTRQRVLAGVVAFAVFAGAGAFAWRALTPRGAPTGTIGNQQADLIVDLSTPEADGSENVHVDASYLGLSRQFDSATHPIAGWGIVSPPEPLRFPTALPTGTSVVLRSDADRLFVSLSQEPPASDSSPQVEYTPNPGEPIPLPSEPGLYTLNFSADWSDAGLQAISSLLVEVVPAAAPVVTFTRDGGLKSRVDSYPSAVLLWQGRATPLELDGLGGDLGSGGMTTVDFAPPEVNDAVFLELPVGERLVVAGDATIIDGTVREQSFPDGPSGDPLPLRSGTFDPLDTLGRVVLTFSVVWAPGTRSFDTHASFFLPVDVVPGQPSPVPTVEPAQDGVVVIANTETTEDPVDPVHVSIRMLVDGVEVEGTRGSSSTDITHLDGSGVSGFGDAAPPEFRPSDFVPVPAGSGFAVRGNATEVIVSATSGADPFKGSHEFDPSAGHLPDLSAGRHVLAFDVTWEVGPSSVVRHVTATLATYFPIEIVPAASPAPGVEDILRIDCSANPVVATPVVAAGPEGVDVRSPDAGNLEFKNEDTGQFLAWGTDTPLPAPDPGGRAVLPFDPGTWTVICDGNGTSAGTFRVIDAAGAA
jgi:hypothetical protein